MDCLCLRCVVLLCLFFVAHNSPQKRVNDKSPLVIEYEAVNPNCGDDEVSDWSNDFHGCYIDKKYSDGGRDLNNIVERIFDHAEACVENSSKICRPNGDGFLVILNRTISQMKDFASMYLEAIYNGRDNIKDLKCVESTLTLESYKECFESLFNETGDKENFNSTVEDGIRCVNRRNADCSKAAKSTLNRMVRKVLHVSQPDEESFEEEKKPEEPWMWYDYLAYPFVTAWKAIRNFFGF